MRNVEIKARIADFKAFLKRALDLSDKPEVIMKQTDTYFKVNTGRLKLRQIQSSQSRCAELIYYNRPDSEGPKLSDYCKQEFKSFEEAEGLRKVLESSLGVVGIVNKQRHLLMVERTRIHVDNVDKLGSFMELEVVLNDEETLEDGQKVADELMSRLGISQADLISGSYINMLPNTKD